MNEKRKGQVLQQAFGIALSVLLLAGCSNAPAEPTATPTLEEAAPASTPAPSPTVTEVQPTKTPTPVPSPSVTPEPVATAIPPTDTPTPLPPPTATQDIARESVNFTTEDGLSIAATLFGEGDIAVILLHQGVGNASQMSWHPFAKLAAERGFAALTVDYRGRGESEGNPSEPSILIRDARAAVEFLQGRGFGRMVCIGSAMWGGVPCMRLALEVDEMEGLVVLSNSMTVGLPGSLTEQELSQLALPKLFIYGEKERDSVPEAMQQVYRLSPEPKEIIAYDSSARGTNLLRSPYGDDLRQSLLDFLEGLRSGVPASAEGLSIAWEGDYLGQTPPGLTPEIFAPGIVSTEVYEAAGTFSPDGKEFVFTRDRDSRLWFTTLGEGGWTTPQLVPFSHDSVEFEPHITPDGQRLYYSSFRPLPDGSAGGPHTWFVEKTAGAWGEPQLFDWLVGDGHAMYSSVSHDKTFYTTSAFAIYKAEWVDGQYAQPVKLGQEINGLPTAAHPYIAPDGSYLIFDAQVGGRLKPSIFISLRLDDGSWSTPQNMGDEINATESEMCASVSPDGKYLFFSREVNGNRDVYWVDAKVIDAYRPASSPTPLLILSPENAADTTQLRVLEWPEGAVSSLQCTVDFTLDQRMVAAACFDKHIPFWDVETGQLAYTILGHTAEVVSLDFSPDGRTFATGGLDNLIQLWDVREPQSNDVESGERLRTLSGHEGGVWSVAFSADGQTLASASADKSVRLWDVETGELLRTFTGHRRIVLSVAYSPDGRTLASGSVDHTVRLWDVREPQSNDAPTGELLRAHQEPQGNVGHVAFSPDGRTLAAGSDDDLIRLWDVETGELLRTLEGHEGWVNGVAFSPDGRLLASGSHDKAVGLWDVNSGQLLHKLEGHEDTVLRVAFSPDGRMVASVSWDGSVRLWGMVGASE